MPSHSWCLTTTPVTCVKIPVRGVALVREIDCLAATIEDVIQNLIAAGGATAGANDPAFDISKLDRGILSFANQVVGDDGLVAAVHGDPPAAVGRHVVGGAAFALRGFPEDVVVDHVGFVGGFKLDAAAQRLEIVAHHVAGHASV